MNTLIMYIYSTVDSPGCKFHRSGTRYVYFVDHANEERFKKASSGTIEQQMSNIILDLRLQKIIKNRFGKVST